MALPKGSLDLENCPVPEDVLKRLLDAALNATADLGDHLPEGQRAALAVFCYRRSHLRPLGLKLAAECEKQTLVREAGHAGELIFAQSQSPASNRTDTYGRSRHVKAPVSLYKV